MYSNQDLRDLMESIGEIEEAHGGQIDADFEHAEHKEGDPCHHKDAKDMLKCVIGALKDVAKRITDGDVSDSDTLEDDLHRIHNIVIEMSDAEDKSEKAEKKVDEDRGADVTLKMAPKHNSKGVPNYSDPHGDSYAARKGFTGI